jgi:hypothetical protein
MTATLDSQDQPAPATAAPGPFGQRLAPAGDPLEGASFDALYEAKIKPELIKREAERQAAMRTFIIAVAAGCVAVFLENLFAPDLTGGAVHVVGWQIAIPTLVGFAIFGYMPLIKVSKNAKAGVIQALCAPLGIGYSIAGKEAPSFDHFRSLNLLPSGDTAFEDFFTGRRGDVEFALCEATIHQGSGKNRRLVFQGQLFRLITRRRLASTTVVLRNTGWLKSFECPRGLESVGLEDPVFNKAFAVFGSDQVEAREVLTPVFMQHLVDLETAYAGGHIRCAFSTSELLIALEGHDSFEIGGMFSTLVERSRVEGIARNIEQVFKMIDEFRAA